jgi:hypothetical protein
MKSLEYNNLMKILHRSGNWNLEMHEVINKLYWRSIFLAGYQKNNV